MDLYCCDGTRRDLAHCATPQTRQVRSWRAYQIESDLNALGTLAEQYRLEHENFPDVSAWRRLTRNEDPSFYDPWGRPYQYERTVDGVTIRTLGRDGIDGGMGMDADLSAHFSSSRANRLTD